MRVIFHGAGEMLAGISGEGYPECVIVRVRMQYYESLRVATYPATPIWVCVRQEERLTIWLTLTESAMYKYAYLLTYHVDCCQDHTRNTRKTR